MKMVCNTALLTLMVLSPAVLLLRGQSPTALAGMAEKTNLRNVRYCEILVERHGLSATASVYNTLGLNDCPEAKWSALNADKLKNELLASKVILSGPRYFTMDRNALAGPGEVATFDGLEARLLAQLEINKRRDRALYTENTVERQNQYVYDQGKNVYELLAPGGRTYLMQSYSQEVDQNLNEEGLLTLQNRLQLPSRWEYRVSKLEKDLVVRNSGGKAKVIQDDLRDSYQLIQ
jgi:hypothetical protein